MSWTSLHSSHIFQGVLLRYRSSQSTHKLPLGALHPTKGGGGGRCCYQSVITFHVFSQPVFLLNFLRHAARAPWFLRHAARAPWFFHNMLHILHNFFFLHEIFAFYLKMALTFKCTHLLPNCKRNYVLFTHVVINTNCSLIIIKMLI